MKQFSHQYREVRGFTIVELLIVVVVIAILASITLISYNGITSRAKISAVTVDLTTAYAQLAKDNLNDGVYPVSAAASNGGQGLKSSNGTLLNYVYKPASNTYCLSATNGLLVYRISSSNNAAVEGQCVSTEGLTTTFAGSGAQGSTNGTGTSASFYYPYGIAIDANENLYIADTYNQRIRKITSAGVVTTLAGSGSVGSTNGTGTAASFNNPAGIAIDSAGNLFIADMNNHLIRKITSAGVVTTLAGTAGVSGSANGTGTAATFHTPFGVALGSDGTVYVADTFNMLIRKITPAGVVTTVAGTANVIGAANATGTAATFNYPRGVSIDAVGNLYIADTNNQLIRKIAPGGVVTTFAGSAGVTGAVNATGTAATFNFPGGTVVNANGYVFVADMTNNLIRQISPSGVVTTLAGSGAAGAANGTGVAASFYTPVGLAADASGNVYVADTINNLIRKISN